MQNPASCLIPFSDSQTSFSVLYPGRNTQASHSLLYFVENSPVKTSFTPFLNFEMLHCPLGPFFLLPKRKWGQIVSCRELTAFSWFCSMLLHLQGQQNGSLLWWNGSSTLVVPSSQRKVLKTCEEQEAHLPRALAVLQLVHPRLLCPAQRRQGSGKPAFPGRRACLAPPQNTGLTGLPSDLMTYRNSNMWHFVCNVMSSSLRSPGAFQWMCSYSVVYEKTREGVNFAWGNCRFVWLVCFVFHYSECCKWGMHWKIFPCVGAW